MIYYNIITYAILYACIHKVMGIIGALLGYNIFVLYVTNRTEARPRRLCGQFVIIYVCIYVYVYIYIYMYIYIYIYIL